MEQNLIFLYAYTPSHISDTRRSKPQLQNYLLLGFRLKLAVILTKGVEVVGRTLSQAVFQILLYFL